MEGERLRLAVVPLGRPGPRLTTVRVDESVLCEPIVDKLRLSLGFSGDRKRAGLRIKVRMERPSLGVGEGGRFLGAMLDLIALDDSKSVP